MEASELDNIFLFLGFVFTFFIPGFLIIETFFKEYSPVKKLPLIFLVSILVSTYTVYLISLVIGFSRFSVLLSFLLFVVWLLVFLIRSKFSLRLSFGSIREHSVALLVSAAIFILFLIALYPAIFFHYQNYFVMSAVNWQDTAMHLSIIESIAQGNFPPQAPYFSGQPLNYYYFIDLHSAVLQTLYSKFFPRVLIYDNPFFVLIFFLSLYALSYDFFKSRLAAILTGLLATFCGNFLYLKFFQDLSLNFDKSIGFFNTAKFLIARGGYTMDYQQLMQMVPVADYFLQNRPMMVGIPVVVLIILLLKNGFEENRKKYFILAGLLAAMLVKFQLFAFGVSILILFISWVIFAFKKYKNKVHVIGYFFLPVLIFAILYMRLFNDNNYVISTLLANFRFGPWDLSKSFFWYLTFPFANFGILFWLFLLFTISTLIYKLKITRSVVFILILSAILFFIPYAFYFTIYDGDMLKFFYFLIIPLSLISGLMLQRIWRISVLGPVLVSVLLFVSSISGFLTLGWSFFNKYQGYSEADYQAGIWTRVNTLPMSVFMTLPTVHSAVSDIGGRLRVLSYTLWPYSHGFNKGADNVFAREADIQSVYKNPSNTSNLMRVTRLYKINYIFVGLEENNKFPLLKEQLKLQPYLQLVYDLEGVQIYKIL